MRLNLSMLQNRMVKNTITGVMINSMAEFFVVHVKYQNLADLLPAFGDRAVTEVRLWPFLNDFEPESLCIN